MQSGISATADLHEAFSTLLSTPTSRGLLATISNESLTPSTVLPRSHPTSTFTDDLSTLTSHLTPTAASYILLKEDSTPTKCVAITYVPDAAPVRQKMLFASTRLTLVRELGTEHFSNTLFATSVEELSPTGWKKQVEHGALAAPLTEEERSLEGIREAEAAESRGTGGRRGGHVVAGGVSMEGSEEAVEALRGLGGEGAGAVVLNLDLTTEKIALVSTHSGDEATPSTLAKVVSATNPTYSFYYHTPTSEVLFIYCCPAGCSVKERMTYAASARSVPVMAEREAELQVAHKMEVSGVDELDEKSILKEIEPEKPATGTGSAGGFARPKRPGRR